MNRRRLGFVMIMLGGVGLGTYAIAASGSSEAQDAQGPVAVVPVVEEPSQKYMELKQHAVRLPSGIARDGDYRVAPAVVSPSR